MLKNRLSLALLLFSLQLFSQVGINTTTPNAQLEVKSSNESTPANTDGIIIPKINAFPTVNPTAGQQGMMVYLTTTVGSRVKGFYYWDNSTATWIGVGSNTANAWGLTGNAGTTSGNNFIGTTDDVDLVFKRNNVLVGKLAINNTSFGLNSLFSNTTGNSNTANGRSSLYFNTTGSNNTANGSFSLFSNTSGTFNTANGSNSLFLNTTGNYNTANGSSSLSSNTTGYQNTANGASSLSSNTTGFQNIANGNDALYSNTTGCQNTANGVSSLYSNTTGNSNTANGFNSLYSNTTGIANTANGYSSLRSNTTGIGNTANGIYSLYLNTTGNYNTANGFNSLRSNTTGYQNIANGNDALYSNTTGYENTATGDSALPNNTTGFNNTALGHNALAAVTTGNFNTAIGSEANTSSNSFSNATAIGSRAMAGNSNVLVLGSINGVNGATSSVSVGVGITAPAAPLHVRFTPSISSITPTFILDANEATTAANITFRNSITANSTSMGMLSNGDFGIHQGCNFGGCIVGTEVLRIKPNGNVGIGTSNPLEKFHVVGNIRMVDGNQAAGKVLTSDGFGTATWQNPSNNAWGLTGNSGLNASTNFMGTSDDVDVVFKRFNTRAGLIGTTNTSFGLSALSPTSTGTNNTAIGSGSLDVNTTGIDNMAAGFNTLTSNTSGSHNTTIGVAAMVSNLTGNFNTAIGRSALFDNTSGINNTGVGYNALGNVTIGTNNTAIGYNSFPSIIQGNNNTALGAETNVNSTILENATALGYRAMVGNSNTMVLGSINGVNGATSSVNVGIGTISPQTALEVVDTSAITGATVEGTINVMTNGPQAIDTGGSITLGGSVTDAGTTFRTFGSIEGRKATATTSVSSGYLLFKTNNAGTLSERMRITNVGDVGIGTAAPGGQFELSLNEGRKPTSNTWTIPSDARLKNVNGVYEKGLEAILQLKPIRYHYKNTGGRTFEQKVLDKEAFGFLAQEVQTIFPEAVGTDPDGYLNFDLHPILIASVNAMKELNEKNTDLKKENQNLKQSLEDMRQEMELIKSEIEKLKP